MRIALVTPSYLPDIGGLEVHVGNLARRLAAAGHTVDVLTQAAPSAPRLDHADGAAVRRFPVRLGGRAYPFAPGLWSYLRRHSRGYDVIHAHSYHGTAAVPAALSPARCLVFTPHYLGGGRTVVARAAHRPYRLVGQVLFQRARHVVCTTAAEAEMVAAAFPGASEKTAVIPNGIDVDVINDAVPQPHKGTVILYAGRLETYKNVHQAVAALPFLDDAMSLVIVGAGPAAGSLAGLAARLGVASRVQLVGAVPWPDVYRWFRAADVFVTMSARESFGMSLLEAHVAGAQLVASDIAVHREVAARIGPAAALVPLSATPAGLAAAIRRAAAAPRPPVGEISEIPSWDDHVAALLRLYTQSSS